MDILNALIYTTIGYGLLYIATGIVAKTIDAVRNEDKQPKIYGDIYTHSEGRSIREYMGPEGPLAKVEPLNLEYNIDWGEFESGIKKFIDEPQVKVVRNDKSMEYEVHGGIAPLMPQNLDEKFTEILRRQNLIPGHEVLKDYGIRELRALSIQLDIPGRTKMNKPELFKLISQMRDEVLG